MAKDERTEPIAASVAPDPSPGDDADDTEGHSMGLLMGVNVLSNKPTTETRTRSKQPTEEELPPLSKTWPSMRDEKKA